jgi:trehalose synthase
MELPSTAGPTAAALYEVPLGARSFERYAPYVSTELMSTMREIAAQTRERLGERVLWDISSTRAGGGVAELLHGLLPYVRGAGIDARWMVISGSREFFRVTKGIHNALHGVADETVISDEARAIYEDTLRVNAAQLESLIRPHDIVIAHDPQTAGLVPHLSRQGALVIWRSHIGHERPDGPVEAAWTFLAPYLLDAHALVFSREAYVPAHVDRGRSVVLPPSVDIFSPKNQPMDDEVARAILVHTGIIEGPPDGSSGRSGCIFTRADGSPGRVDRAADIIRLGRAPAWDTPLVAQVSRWDALKDPIGVLQGFARLLEPYAPDDAHLVLAGPDVDAVADDPEGTRVFAEVVAAWRKLPQHQRHRVHVVMLPMVDLDENAAIVNALQRHARVVVQKSLHEGFGLTVTEAMWKGRAVVASAVGGIQDQIRHQKDGLLLDDPSDLERFAEYLHEVLADPQLAHRLGASARARVRENYLGLHSLLRYARVIERIDSEAA